MKRLNEYFLLCNYFFCFIVLSLWESALAIIIIVSPP